MLFYCQKGDLLKIDPSWGPRRDYLLGLKRNSFTLAIPATNARVPVQLQAGDVVTALEASVPPWYEADIIRCLHKDKIVHVYRRDLSLFKPANDD